MRNGKIGKIGLWILSAVLVSGISWATIGFKSDSAGNISGASANFTGNVGVASGSKYYLDGIAMSGNTYTSELRADNAGITAGGGSTGFAANEIWGSDELDTDASFYINLRGYHAGSTRFRTTKIGNGEGGTIAEFTGGDSYVYLAKGLAIKAAQSFYLDSNGATTTGDTLISEVAADKMMLQTGGNQTVFTDREMYTSRELDSNQTYSINLHGYNDGVTRFRNTVIGDGKNAALVTFNGASTRIEFATPISIPTTKDFFLDGATGNDEWKNSADGQNDLYAAGTLALRTKSTGESLLPAVDPPTANYANQNGIVKAWAQYASDGTLQGTGYNVVGNATHGSTGVYTVTFDTDFANTNYACTVSPYTGATVSATMNSAATGSAVVDMRTTSTTTLTDAPFMLICMGLQ
jgi:hypothetical protein